MATRPEPDLNRTGPQRGSGFGLRARTGPGSGSGFGEKGLRTGPDRTAATLIRKPKARISIFRAEVKDRCVAAVMLAIDTDNSPAAIAGIVDDLLKDFNYIYPRQSKVSAARPQFSGKHTETMLTI